MSEHEEKPMLRPGEQLRCQWDVKKKLGGGGFGQIYIAYDTKRGLNVAIKCEKRGAGPNHLEVLSMEYTVLKELEGTPHFCRVFGSGQDPGYNFLVMTLCGPNLTDLRHDTPNSYFSFGTAIQLIIQCIESVCSLHNAGYLHRDIKPANFAMGRDGPEARMVYMVDFGLARKYIKWVINADGEKVAVIRRERDRVGFRGTVRYASIAIHENREMGRVDDLWSVFYMMIEMACGKVPWRTENDRKRVLDMKRQWHPLSLAEMMPAPIHEMVDHMSSLSYGMQPNYNYMVDRLSNALRMKQIPADAPFDWEEGYTHCKAKNRLVRW